MPWLCTRLSRWMLSKAFSKSIAIQYTVRWCCAEWRSGPCTLVLFVNLLALVRVAGPLLQRSAWWWALLGSCWNQTEGWLLSSCYSRSGLLCSEFHDDGRCPVFRLSGAEAFPLFRDLMVAMMSSFSGGVVLISCTFASIIGSVCSELRWNALPILPSVLLSWWEHVAFLVYPQSSCVSGSVVSAADERGDLVNLSLFFLVGGLFCLTCQVFHVGRLSICDRRW